MVVGSLVAAVIAAAPKPADGRHMEGMALIIQGLKGRPELNGQDGTIGELDWSKLYNPKGAKLLLGSSPRPVEQKLHKQDALTYVNNPDEVRAMQPARLDV